ncbi:MAG: hypothetical protein AB4063_19745 [Crocosphaera sp.]
MNSFELIVKDISENNDPNNLKYTHSEIIALVACLEEIDEPINLESDNCEYIRGLLKGLRKYGITHNTRSNIAKIILRILEKDKRDKEAKREAEKIFGSCDYSDF